MPPGWVFWMFCSGWILVSGIVRQIAQRHLARQRVVGILDQAFDGIVTTKVNFETNLQNARALFESHLQSVFTQRGGVGLRNSSAQFVVFRMLAPLGQATTSNPRTR